MLLDHLNINGDNMEDLYQKETELKNYNDFAFENYEEEILKEMMCYKLSCFNQAKSICEKCGQVFCSDHINVYWSQNFLQHAFVGQKRKFLSKNLCSKCERDNRVIGVFLAFFLLFPFLFTPLLILFG